MNRKIDTIPDITEKLELNKTRVAGLQKQIRQVKQNNYRAILLEDLDVYKSNVRFFAGRLKHLQEAQKARKTAELEATQIRLNKVMYLIGLEETTVNEYQNLVEESSWLETEIKLLKREIAC